MYSKLKKANNGLGLCKSGLTEAMNGYEVCQVEQTQSMSFPIERLLQERVQSLQVVLLTSPNAIFAFCASPIVASGYKMVSPCHFHLYLDLVQHPNDHQVVMTNHTGVFKDIIKHNFKHEATTQVSKVSFGCSSLMHTENSPQYKSCMVHKT